MHFPEYSRPSPNFDAAPANEALGVLFHHSVESLDATVARMLHPESKVSYHVIIGRDGARCALVRDEHIAWHAGASRFLGRNRCNDFLLGVAFEGDTYVAPLTPAQIASALEWLAARWTKYGWTISRLTDHRQASPGRKNDLNPTEWQRLQEAIGTRFASGPDSQPA